MERECRKQWDQIYGYQQTKTFTGKKWTSGIPGTTEKEEREAVEILRDHE
jgi:hypothetical protein